MASSSNITNAAPIIFSSFKCILFLLLITSNFNHLHVLGCFTSIISFGDSLADTGNLIHLWNADGKPFHFSFPPYGETYFRRPTGRCSDGRLVIDFLAEYYGLPYIPPYAMSNNSKMREFKGVNFAVVGATAMDASFFQKREIHDPYTNNSLGVQLDWFKQMLTSLCPISSNCNEILKSSLILMGEIGGNDYNHALLSGRNMEEVRSFVPPVVNAIASAIHELIEMGAETFLVPGNLPIGCSAAYLSYFKTKKLDDYDPETGCLIWLNQFAEYHNELLQRELNQIRELHPHATIIYADYYKAAMPFFHSPHNFGFTKGALSACCGGGGPYNYNSTVACGYLPATACEDPSRYVNWDGLHLTEAAYKLIAKGLLEGPFTTPHINELCLSQPIHHSFSHVI